MEKNNEVGRMIREFRLEKRWTLEVMAKMTGYSRPYLTQIENGTKGSPPEKTLTKIASTLGYPENIFSLAKRFDDPKKMIAFTALDLIDLLNRTVKNLTMIEVMLEGNKHSMELNAAYLKGEQIYSELERKVIPEDLKDIISNLIAFDNNGREYARRQIQLYSNLKEEKIL
jgi:transcriptional regulator with XRE-family HTH domain